MVNLFFTFIFIVMMKVRKGDHHAKDYLAWYIRLFLLCKGARQGKENVKESKPGILQRRKETIMPTTH